MEPEDWRLNVLREGLYEQSIEANQTFLGMILISEMFYDSQSTMPWYFLKNLMISAMFCRFVLMMVKEHVKYCILWRTERRKV